MYSSLCLSVETDRNLIVSLPHLGDICVVSAKAEYVTQLAGIKLSSGKLHVKKTFIVKQLQKMQMLQVVSLTAII